MQASSSTAFSTELPDYLFSFSLSPSCRTPIGLEDVSKYPMLLAAVLQEPGWTDEDVAKLAGGNFLRVLHRAEQVRESQRAALVKVVCCVS